LLVSCDKVPAQIRDHRKAVGGAPQYTLRIKEWKTDAPIGADAFVFTPPGANKVALDALVNIDEVPQGVVTGAKK
jgi:hypothetical protein